MYFQDEQFNPFKSRIYKIKVEQHNHEVNVCNGFTVGRREHCGPSTKLSKQI